MDCLAPLGPVYQAGTLSGNPLAMAAGLTTLEELSSSDAYCHLEEMGQQLAEGLKAAAKSAGVALQVNNIGSMFCGYFTSEPVHNLAEAMRSDRSRFSKFFHGMLDQGIYFAPSQFETGFISTAHTHDDIDQTVKAAAKAMARI
jgi:glutamate-1-semialdehyde 2,1-aminomutase